jgi:glycerophosphoryl diester phosphodiesterase
VAPENTLAAFARAVADGADGIELDVRLARDGIPVVIHDATLRRTAMRAGIVAKMTANELGRIDVGSWFNLTKPACARPDYVCQFVPTLNQTFRFFNEITNRQTIIYIELKTDGDRRSANRLAQSVVQSINEFQFVERVVVVSFNLKALAALKEIDPAICTGALFEPRLRVRKLLTTRRMIATAIETGAGQVLLHGSLATPGRVRAVIESQLVPVVWTINDVKWIETKKAAGVHAIITNIPAELAAAQGKILHR